jgi:hypothetical protein
MSAIILQALKSTNLLEWLKVVSPLPVTIAIFFVTWSFYRWQIRLAKQKLRHDLYDRRFAIYTDFRELLLAIVDKEPDVIKVKFRKAGFALSQATFLLDDPSVQKYLQDLYGQITHDVLGNILFVESTDPAMRTDPHIGKEFGERADLLSSARADLPGHHLAKLPEQFARFLRLTDFWK